MLILSRKTNQRLVIGDSIEITVVEVRDGHVRLGISAPKNVPVYRKELLEEVLAENKQAVVTAQDSDMGSNAIVPGAACGQPMVATLSASGTRTQLAKGG